MQPHQPIQPVAGDPTTWPTRAPGQLAPYGLSMNPSDLLSRTWSHFKGDSARLIGITAVPYVVMIICATAAAIGFVVGAPGFDPDALLESGPVVGGMVGGALGLLITLSLLFVAAQAGTFLVVEERIRGEGRTLSAFGALLAGVGSLWRLLGAMTLMTLTAMLVFSPSLGLGIAAVATESIPLGVLAAALGMPSLLVMMYGGMRLTAVVPAIVVEDLSIVAAVHRSLALTRGAVADIFVAFLCLGAVMFGLNMVTSIIGIIPIIGALFQLVVGILMASVQTVFIFMVYGALRDRNG